MQTFIVIIGHGWTTGEHDFRNKYHGGVSPSVYPASAYLHILQDDHPSPLEVTQVRHNRWHLAQMTTDCPESDWVAATMSRTVMGTLSNIRNVTGSEMFDIALTKGDTPNEAVKIIPRDLWTRDLVDRIRTMYPTVYIPYYVNALLK